MKTKMEMIWKRYKKGIACVLAAVLLVQSCYMTKAQELSAALESVSENAVDESGSGEALTQDALRDSGMQETDALWTGDAEGEEKFSRETVSQNSVSENTTDESVSENTTGEVVPDDALDESVSENTADESEPGNMTEESVLENTPEESVSENTPEESVSENALEESVSENTMDESVSENTADESLSENTTEDSVSVNTMRVDSAEAADRASVPPTAPTVKSVVPKDTTALIHFTHLLEGGLSEGILYEALLTDEVSGTERILSGNETGVVTIGGYDGSRLNTFRLSGLSANKKYSVVLQAKYGDAGTPVSSAKKTFTTKKDMLATDGTMKVRYADMEALKNDRTKKPEEVPTTGVEMRTGESCGLYAQVSRLMRAVETDKLKWTVTPLREDSAKNGLKVKAGKSTYEAVLTAQMPGSYQVTATNTISKEEVARFQVTVK